MLKPGWCDRRLRPSLILSRRPRRVAQGLVHWRLRRSLILGRRPRRVAQRLVHWRLRRSLILTHLRRPGRAPARLLVFRRWTLRLLVFRRWTLRLLVFRRWTAAAAGGSRRRWLIQLASDLILDGL